MKPLSEDNPIQLQTKKYSSFSKYILLSSVKPNIVWRYLGEIPPRDTSMIYLKTGVIYQEDFEQICKIIETIVRRSSLFIRILSPSILIFDLAHKMGKYKNRILYSLPILTGVSDKLVILRQLQVRQFLTYGMLSPSESNVCELINVVNPELCETIWIETVPGKEKQIFQDVEKTFKKKQVFDRIRSFVCTTDLSIEDDQYFKMFPKNIVFYEKEMGV